MATIKFDKDEYHQGDIAYISYSGVAARSNFNIHDAAGHRHWTEYVSGSGTYKWQTSISVAIGKCCVRLYTPPAGKPVAFDTAVISRVIPVKPPPPELPEGYIDAFAVTPSEISLTPGRYDVILTLKGFGDTKATDIIINDKQITPLNISLSEPTEPKSVTFKSNPPNAVVTVRAV